MEMSHLVAKRSTCLRRKVGAILVKDKHILSTGYNGAPKGLNHCSEVGCLKDAEDIPLNARAGRCRAMHAEMWALTNLVVNGGVSAKGADMYLNVGPCEICGKLITQSGIENVILLEGAHSTSGTNILREAGINIRYVKL